MRSFWRREAQDLAELEKLLRDQRSEAPSWFVRALAREAGTARHPFRPPLRYALVAGLAVALIAAGVSAGVPGPPTPPAPNNGPPGPPDPKHPPPPPPPSKDQYESQCGSPPYEQCVVEVNPDHPNVKQPASGTTTLTFTLTVKKPSHGTFSVAYSTTTGGTATPGEDYTPASGSVTFGPGDKSESFSITILGEAPTNPAEPDQTFTVSFTAGAPAVMDKDDNSQTVTIQAAKPPPPPPKPKT